jgi:O-antigen/teichoic acid export membrane protein
VLIRRALPAFTPSIDVVHIMVAASFLIALVHMPTELLITINRRWSATAIMLIGLLVNVGANYLVVGIWHKGITGAAWATALSYLVLLSMTTAYGLAAGLGGRDAIHHLLLVLACVGYSLGLLWGIETALGHGASIASDLALGIAKWLLFLLLCAPWFLYAERRFHGVTTLVGLLKQGARYLRRETSDVTAAV